MTQLSKRARKVEAKIYALVRTMQCRVEVHIERYMIRETTRIAKEMRLCRGTRIQFDDAMGSSGFVVWHRKREYKVYAGGVYGRGWTPHPIAEKIMAPFDRLLWDYAILCDLATVCIATFVVEVE